MKEKLAEWLTVIQGFRKFLITLLVIFIGVVFRVKGFISGSETTDLIKSIGISFIAANNLEGFAAILKDHLAIRRAAGNVLKAPDEPAPSTDDEVTLVPTGDQK
jgi:hypothetical protein